MLSYETIPRPYHKLIRGIELLNQGEFNSCFILGSHGLGKSHWTDYALNKLKANYVLFSGDVSDSYAYEFMYKNRDKIIVMRDVAKLLRRLPMIDILKSVTEPRGKRIISRQTYAEHNIPEEFEFKGKIIFEINDVMKRYKEDLEALFSRGLFVELIMSFDDIIQIMYQICKADWQRWVTDYLIQHENLLGRRNFNLRMQDMAFKIYKASQRDNKDWKEELKTFFSNESSEARKLLYRCAGNNRVKRIEFVKFLMQEKAMSYSTAERRVSDYIILGDIHTDSKQKQGKLCLHPIQTNDFN